MILSWIIRFFRTFGREPGIHWLLAGLALGSAGMGLADVVHGFPGGQAFLLTTLAVIVGWALARSRWAVLVLAPVLILAGWIIALFMQADLTPGITAWIRAAYMALREYIRLRDLGKIDLGPLTLAGSEITTILVQVQDRLSAWLSAWGGGKAAYDPLAIGLVWLCVFWVLGIWTGWSFRQWRKPMVSLLPAGLLMIGSLNYALGDARYLLPFSGFLFAWSAITTYKDAHHHWHVDHVDYAEDIPLDFSLATSGIIILLLLVGFLAASMPVISVKAAVAWAQEVFNPGGEKEEAVAKSFGLNRENPPTYFQLLRSGELPRKHLIGSGPDLSQRVVMSVQVIQTANSVQPGNEQSGWRYYWRSLTYDEYTGLGWQSSPAEEGGIPAGSMIHAQEFVSQRLVETQVRLIEDIGPMVYAAGELLTVNANFTAATRPVRLAPDQLDLKLDLFGASISEKEYRVLSTISGADVNTLRNSGDRYPDWIAQRYITLPPGIPDRVLELAGELTRGAPTPYDKALLIESYLRKIPYTLDLPAPPADRDIVDYFLFDLKKGYCDYYATAMVVMARSIGIPARLAMGYASGGYDPVNQRYLVSEADAHSWPEIYFPGSGWVEFEPTGGRPEAQRPALDYSQPPSSMPPDFLKEYQQPMADRLVHSWLFWVIGIALFALTGYLTYRSIHFNRLPPGDFIIETYRRFHRQAQPLAEPLPAGHTPLELAQRLEQWMADRPSLMRRIPYLKRIIKLVNRLTELYMQVIYSPRTPGVEEQQEARKLWRMLKLPLRLSRLSGTLMQFNGENSRKE